MPHARTAIVDAVRTALETAGLDLVEATDAVQAEDVPCAVLEEREETMRGFDDALDHPTSTLRRRFRLVIFAFGTTRSERDDVAATVEAAVAPAVYAAGHKVLLVGVGFSRSNVGTSAAAFVAGQFYDVEYFTPTHL